MCTGHYTAEHCSLGVTLFKFLILYLFYEDYIQPEAIILFLILYLFYEDYIQPQAIILIYTLE
jgi:hypothetical protein